MNNHARNSISVVTWIHL